LFRRLIEKENPYAIVRHETTLRADRAATTFAGDIDATPPNASSPIHMGNRWTIRSIAKELPGGVSKFSVYAA
jgi:hypothetical protein